MPRRATLQCLESPILPSVDRRGIEYLGYLKKCDEPDGSFDLPALVAESHSQLKD